MIKTVHSKEVHYIVSLEEIMNKLKIPNTTETDYIGCDFDEKTEVFTFKQIEQVE